MNAPAKNEKAWAQPMLTAMQFIITVIAILYLAWKIPTKDDMHREFEIFRSDIKDMRSDITDIRTEIRDIRTEIGVIRTEIRDIRTEIGVIRTEINSLNQTYSDHLAKHHMK